MKSFLLLCLFALLSACSARFAVPPSPGDTIYDYYAYALHQDSNALELLNFDPNTGELHDRGEAAVATGSAPNFILATASAKYAYVANLLGNSISVYAIEAKDGSLTPIQTFTHANISRPRFLALHPNDRVLFVANNETVGTATALAISENGTLTHLSTQAVGAAPRYIAADPTGRFVYVPNHNSATVSQLSFDVVTGTLTSIAADAATLAGPAVAVVHPSGNFLAVSPVVAASPTVHVFEINPDGTLGTRSEYPLNDPSTDIRFHPNGESLFAIQFTAMSLQGFSFDTSTGAPTSVSLSSPDAGNGGFAAFSPDAKFMIIPSNSTKLLHTFSLTTPGQAIRTSTYPTAYLYPIATTIVKIPRP